MGESSATLNGIRNESLSLDHSGMNKFEDSQDDNYKSVSRQILKMAKGSKQILENRQRSKDFTL